MIIAGASGGGGGGSRGCNEWGGGGGTKGMGQIANMDRTGKSAEEMGLQ
jgi:hypothetical protein